ncbi:NlpC/P60 family protein [Tabrizicola sp.]|jgi:cell wall-associated NlpC family hydrolase|uniref:C40 family peptidase n=1 Tax=Tabrizicola sp. TaxID=2005166 RepID=UPI001A3821EF|nr:NlpC/P60 family protein [Tabrizicola sp.]MBL9061376.1 C40 family peptidase [Tabrizicola sp.]
MDRRLTPFSGRVAHVSLSGLVNAPLTEGLRAQVIVPVANLCVSVGGARDRQLLMGDAVTVIDRDQGHVFVMSDKDGYCGWMAENTLGQGPEPTHWVASPGTHLYAEPQVQAPDKMALSMGTRLTVIGSWGAWANTPHGFVPLRHLRALGDWEEDPVAVAESLLGTPYLWGGNSRFGLDCSGLVQLSLISCGKPCPGDSDMQMSLGRLLAPNEPMKRGDLIFWKGHVAMLVDRDRMIHSNGHTMSVAYEGLKDAIARVSAGGGGLVTARQRL